MTYAFPFPSILPAQALRHVDRLLDDAFAARAITPSDAPRVWEPAVTAREDNDGFTLAFDVPGVPADQVEVLAEGGVLTIKGARATAPLGKDERILFGDRPAGEFQRRFRLPKQADLQHITASHANGVLTVRVAKVAPVQPRRVPVVVQEPSQTDSRERQDG